LGIDSSALTQIHFKHRQNAKPLQGKDKSVLKQIPIQHIQPMFRTFNSTQAMSDVEITGLKKPGL
jgi:hypothetical protein